MRDFALVFINGRAHRITGEKAFMMLADYLRYECHLTGTKIVCAEGDCGACSVVRYFENGSRKPERFFEPINSCITNMAQLDGSHIVTVDALAQNSELTPVQSSMVEAHASQCGFCTPGFVMALTGLSEKKLCRKETKIEEKEAKNCLTGNLCRCTGYKPIVEAACEISLKDCQPLFPRFVSTKNRSEALAALKKPLHLTLGSLEVYAPKKLKEASVYLARHSDARLLSGGTDLGVLTNKGRFQPARFVSLHLIDELYQIKKDKKSIRVGARVTLSELRQKVESSIPEFARFLDLFASPQIKNVATLAGNIGNASPIADTPPFLFAMNARQILSGPKGTREVLIDDFYQGYKKTALKKGEFIAFIEFDLPAKNEKLRLFKSSQRKDLDISAVNAAFRVSLKAGKIGSARVAFGGVGPTPLRIKKLEAFIEGRAPSEETCEMAKKILQEQIQPISDLRGSAAFRRITAENFLTKFFGELAGETAP